MPTVAGTASGIFSADFTDPSTSGALGSISLPSDFTFDASLTAVQFGFGSLNDFAAFDNINIVPEPSTITLFAIALALVLNGRKTW